MCFLCFSPFQELQIRVKFSSVVYFRHSFLRLCHKRIIYDITLYLGYNANCEFCKLRNLNTFILFVNYQT